jgi:hypothetical protein
VLNAIDLYLVVQFSTEIVATGDGCFGEDSARSSAGFPLPEGEICSTRELFGRDRFR